MIASASADDYRKAIEALAGDPSVDAIVAIFIPPLVTQAQDVAEAVRAASEATRDAGKPLLAVWMAQDDAALATLAGGVGGVPAYGTPEEAVRALAHAAALRRPGSRPPRTAPDRPDGIDADAAAATIAEVLAEGGGWLVPDRVAELLSAYGVPQVAATVAATPAAVARCAAELPRRRRGQGDRARAAAQVRRRRSPDRHPRRRRRRPRRARDRGGRARGRSPAGRLPRAVDGARGRRDARRRHVGPGLGPGGRVRRRRPRRRAARRRAVAAGAAQPPRRRRDAARRCARSRCSTATAERRAPTSPRSRTSSCGSPRSPPRTPRSPSSTATRCSSARRRDGGRRARPDRRAAAAAALSVAGPLTSQLADLARHLEVLARGHDERARHGRRARRSAVRPRLRVAVGVERDAEEAEAGRPRPRGSPGRARRRRR